MKPACCLPLVASLAFLAGIFAGESSDKPPKYFTNKMGMKFVRIPPGTFVMGSPREEEKRDEKETEHKVTLTRGFYLGICPVTQEQWLKVMDENFSRFKGKKNLPVENVTWEECQEFLKKMGDKDGQVYRLPTEAEWEYACRAGSRGLYCFGNDPRMLGQYAWYADNAEEKTHPVGQKKPNAWGLYDMHGNIWEWCADWYGDYPPKYVVDPRGPQTGTTRVLRGGSFYSPPLFVRSAIRGYYLPSKRGPNIGFRVAGPGRK